MGPAELGNGRVINKEGGKIYEKKASIASFSGDNVCWAGGVLRKI